MTLNNNDQLIAARKKILDSEFTGWTRFTEFLIPKGGTATLDGISTIWYEVPNKPRSVIIEYAILSDGHIYVREIKK